VSKVVLALACCVVATALIAGCSSSSNPAPWSSQATPPATHANGGALASLRAVDPCGLLDTGTLATLGITPEQGSSQITPQPADLNGCQASGSGVLIELTLGAQSSLGDKQPNKTISGLPAAETTTSDGMCDEVVTLQENPQAGVDVSITDPNDPCTPAVALATTVIARLHNSPPKRANLNGSLATLDPCTTLNNATATAVLGAKAQDGSLIDMYNCSWFSLKDAGPMLGVTFTVGSDPRTDKSNGIPTPVQVGGITAYQKTGKSGCDIRWATHKEQSGDDQIVDVSFGDPEPNSSSACAKTMTAATAVAASLPKN
jgi:hypothetical protein